MRQIGRLGIYGGDTTISMTYRNRYLAHYWLNATILFVTIILFMSCSVERGYASFTAEDELKRIRALYRLAGVPGY